MSLQAKNDSQFTVRKQHLYAGWGGLALALGSTLDPNAEWLGLPLRIGLLCVGGLLAGGLLFRFVLAARPLSSAALKPALGFLFAIHVVATLFFFPLPDIVNDRPVINIDHSFHYYQVARASEILFQTGRLHCYDPYYMAGYPSAIFDLDVKAAELFCAPFGPNGTARALKAFILLCYLLMVVTIYKGSRGMGFSSFEAILGLMAVIAYWHWGRPFAGHFRYAGMFEFVMVSHLALLVCGQFRRFLLGKCSVGFFIVGPLTFLVHPTAVVILALPFLLTLGSYWRQVTWRRVWYLVMWCLTVVIVNAIWIVPLLRYFHFKTASTSFFQIQGIPGMLAVLTRTGSMLLWPFAAVATVGVWWMFRRGRRRELVLSVGSTISLGLVATFGAGWPGLAQLEPGRFFLPAVIFCAPLAGAGMRFLLERLIGAVSVPSWRISLAAGGVAVLAISPLFLSVLSARCFYHHRLTTSPGAEVQRLIAAVLHHTNTSGRLMIEDGPADLYENAHIPGLLARRTGVEQIGGPYPWTFVRHHFATFQSDRMMGEPLEEMDPGDFWKYIDLYNVLWIVTSTADAKRYMERRNDDREVLGTVALERLWGSTRYALWHVRRRPSFARSAVARVVATFNRIEIQPNGETEPFVVKYHWDEGLHVTPPAGIAAVRQLDDPVPFILVSPNGASDIVITY